MRFSTLSTIRRGFWALDPTWVQEHSSIILSALNGESSFSSLTAPAVGVDDKMPVALCAVGVSTAYSVRSSRAVAGVPANTIAVIPISGPILREGDCGPGTMDFIQTLFACEASNNVTGILLDINSPGGDPSGLASFAQAIRSCKKPVVAVTDDGMAASGGYWIGAACKEFYATTSLCSFGSIGAYCELRDSSEANAKAGIKVIQIYAPQSTEKNADYKAAFEGDTTGIEERLGELVTGFSNDVKAGRGNRLNLSKGDPFKGKMYGAKQALAIGLIDGIKPMGEVFNRVAQLAKSSSTSTSTTTMSNKKTYTRISAAAGWQNGHESTEEGFHVTHTDAEGIETALENGAKAATDLATANARIQTLDTENTTLRTDKETLATANETLKAENTRLGKKPAGATTIPTAGDDTSETAPAAKQFDEVTTAAMKMWKPK